jgi:AraC-like DNA-binding protein
MATQLREQTKFWRAADFDHLEMLHATFLTHVYDRHFHEEYVVGMVTRNAYEFYYQHAIHRGHVGHIILINPGEIHSGQPISPDGYTYRTLYPKVSLLQQIAHEITGSNLGLPYFPQPLVIDHLLYQALLRMHHLLENSTSQLERDTAVRAALGGLLLRHADYRLKLPASVGHEHASVNRVRQHLDEHYMENPSLEQLAQVAALSPYHLVRVFRQQTGLPPHMYLTQVRIEHAKQQLQTGASIAGVAAATGFTDQSHLTRRFKRIMGVTPGQFFMGV